MSRTEPDLPSIHIPLAHETSITAELARTAVDVEHHNAGVTRPAEGRTVTAQLLGEAATPLPATSESFTREEPSAQDRAPTQPEPSPGNSPEPEPIVDRAASAELEEHGGRAWPRSPRHDPAAPHLTNDQAERDPRHGWEP
jgi:hypothetical protein